MADKPEIININFDPERIPATTLCALTQFVRSFNDLREASRDVSDATTGLIISVRALYETGDLTEEQRNGLQALIIQMMGQIQSVGANYSSVLKMLAEKYDGEVQEWADVIG